MPTTNKRRIEAVADRFVVPFSLTVLRAVGAARDAVDVDALEKMLARGDGPNAMALLGEPVSVFEDSLLGREPQTKSASARSTGLPDLITSTMAASADVGEVCVPTQQLGGWDDSASTVQQSMSGKNTYHWQRDNVSIYITHTGHASKAKVDLVAQMLDQLPKSFLKNTALHGGIEVTSDTLTVQVGAFSGASASGTYNYHYGELRLSSILGGDQIKTTLAHELAHGYVRGRSQFIADAALTIPEDMARMTAAQKKKFAYFLSAREEAVVESMAHILSPVKRHTEAYIKAFPRTVAAVRSRLAANGVQAMVVAE